MDENTTPNVPENGETGAGEAPATAPETSGEEAPATPEGGETPAGEGEAAGDGDSQPEATA